MNTSAHVKIGTQVKAWNPGTDAAIGRLVAVDPLGHHRVEWFDNSLAVPRAYLGTFKHIEPVEDITEA